MVINIFFSTTQVEIRMVAEIDMGGFVGCSLIVDLKLVLLIKGVSDMDLNVSGVSLFKIMAEIFQENPGTYFKSTGWYERDSELGDEDNIMTQLGVNKSYDEYVSRYGAENARYIVETLGKWDWTKQGQQKGQVTGAYTFGTAVAEVEVDLHTGQVKVLKVTGAHDCGFAINPLAVEGQIEGSFGFALGQSLFETLMMDKGQVMNANFLDYRIPVASDIPDMDSTIIESHDPNGPYGAKEAAESVHPAAIAAIANAIANAAGVRPKALPMTPEKILNLLQKKGQRG